MPERQTQAAEDAAEMLAIDALAWLATEPDILERFLALSGIGANSLRSAAADPAFLAGVLDYLLGDEPLLVAFAANAGVKPDAVVRARHTLDGGKPA